MGQAKAILKNLGLTTLTLVLLFAALIAADRVLGRFIATPPAPDTVELIFPPHSEQTFQTTDFTYTAITNRFGLRDRDFDPAKRPACRILAVGDSFTYGWGVNIEDAWVRRIEERFDADGGDVQVINAGKPGEGPPFFAETAEKAIPLFRPDIVLVTMLQGDDLLGAHDIQALPSARETWTWLRKIFPNTTRLIENARQTREVAHGAQPVRPPEKTTAEDNRKWTENTAREMVAALPPEQRARYDTLGQDVKDALMQGLLNPYMIKLATENPDQFLLNLKLDDPWIRSRIENLAVYLERIKRAADRYGAKVVVASVPYGTYVNREAWRNLQRVGYHATEDMLTSDALDKSIEEACDKAGVPFVSVTDGFRARIETTGLFYPLDQHFTPAGHTLYAELLAEKLTRILPTTQRRSSVGPISGGTVFAQVRDGDLSDSPTGDGTYGRATSRFSSWKLSDTLQKQTKIARAGS